MATKPAKTSKTPLKPRQVFPIILTVDVETILSAYPHSSDCDDPVLLDPADKPIFYILTRAGGVLTGKSSADIVVKAQVGDYVQMRASSLDLNTGYGVMVYAFKADKTVLTPPQMTLARPQTAYAQPPAGCPSKYTTEAVTDIFWKSRVFARGTGKYQGFLSILTEDEDDKVLQLFYTWKGTIKTKG